MCVLGGSLLIGEFANKNINAFIKKISHFVVTIYEDGS